MDYPDYNDGGLLCANLDGSDIKTVVPKCSSHTPKQCVIHQEAQKVYFTWKVESDYKDQNPWYVGIAISKKLGKIFWSPKGFPKASVGRILSSDLELPQGMLDLSIPW